jgi:predicted ATPase
MAMDRLFVKDVRCFRGEHWVRLAPLTILVGENSTGKSTFLALTRLAWDLAYGVMQPDFNEEPFQLGSYDDLVHYGGRGKRAASFSLGLSGDTSVGTSPKGFSSHVVTGTFSLSAGQPALSSISYAQGQWKANVGWDGDIVRVAIETPRGAFSLGSDAVNADLWRTGLNLQTLPLLVTMITSTNPASGTAPPVLYQDLPGLMNSLLSTSRSKNSWGRPAAISPIRSRPWRTYNPLKEIRSPEGAHVPMLLARLGATDLDRWENLAAELSRFGKAAGLFSRLAVHRFDSSESAPFQLRVKLEGQQKEVNLVDVGYGVSQILPILVDCLIDDQPRVFLMQQPEVHLHPRAQAELGTFFASLAAKKRHRFVIETHSDHLLDRIRLEVKNGTLDADALSLLFFERDGSQVRIREIQVDARGNISQQPDSYRRFFLEEELRIVS